MGLPLFDLWQIMLAIRIVPLGYFNMQMNDAFPPFIYRSAAKISSAGPSMMTRAFINGFL
jgi:hypothetical protein